MQLKRLKHIWKVITQVIAMNDIEHPDITHVNRTGYTRNQWRAIHSNDVEDNHDKSEWDDHEEE